MPNDRDFITITFNAIKFSYAVNHDTSGFPKDETRTFALLVNRRWKIYRASDNRPVTGSARFIKLASIN